MTEHDLTLLERIRAEPSSQLVHADDPTALAAALGRAGARSLAADEVAGWVTEAQLLRSRAEAVLAAEEVLAGAVAFERDRRLALAGAALAGAPERAAPTDAGDQHDDDDGPDADRGAVRFALVVLTLAQVGGIAVYVADGLLLAAALPAVTILGVIGVVLAHRRPPSPRQPDDDRIPSISVPRAAGAALDARSEQGSPGSPAVRAAEAHLRRQLAAWKVAWWERDLPPADVGTWLGGPPSTEPATLVVVDPEHRVDTDLYEAMTAALPAAVRVVLVRSRGS